MPFPAAWLALAVAAAAAYANSFGGPFIFDDEPAITENPSIRSLWPPWAALAGPDQSSTAGRPVLNFSLALNYAAGGLDPRGYHAANLAIHILNAGLVMWLLRSAFRSGRIGSRLHSRAGEAAFAGALLWALHPIQTESVTYVIQRAESVLAFFYLATLWAAIRAGEAAGTGSRRGWTAFSALLCALGMGSKEVMVSAPLAVALWDWTFLPKRPGAMKARLPLYASLAATWPVLLGLVASGPRSESAGFGLAGVTPWTYALSQCEILWHYVRLCLWPGMLSLDYGWVPAKALGEVLPHAFAMLAVLALTAVCIVRRRPLGFALGSVLMVLAPSSSFMPVADLAFEHRMYLPLAALAGALAAALAAADRRRLAWTLGAAAAIFAVGTLVRNGDYKSELAIYGQSARARPMNPRPWNNLGAKLTDLGRPGEALEPLARALALKPDYADARYNLGNALLDLGRAEEAEAELREAVRMAPRHSKAWNSLGIALIQRGAANEAVAAFETAVNADPANAEAAENLVRARGEAEAQ